MKMAQNKLKGNNFIKDKKEILNSLLKQLLEQKLSRLEKRNISEIKTFQALSNETQNLILTLEDMSKGVFKQIFIKRQQYISHTNNKTLQSLPNTSNKRPKTPSKKLSKISFNSKMNSKYNTILTEINSQNNKSQIIGKKSKSIKKLNQLKIIPKLNDNNGRKTVANLNIKKIGLIPNSKQRTVSPFSTEKDKFNNTVGNINIGVAKGKISDQKKKLLVKKGKEDNSKLINKNVINTKNNNIINTKLKVVDKVNINSNNKTSAKSNSIDKQENLNINMEIKNKNINKKTENKCPFLNSLSKEFEKVSTIKMDEKLVNDSLLVKNNLDGGKTINIDDLIKGPTFIEEEIPKNSEISNNITKENNNLVKNDNNNNNKKGLNSSILIYNKLKRTKITFLEGEHDFDLIFKDSKIEDIDLNEHLNKEKDNIIAESNVQMTLEEKFESNLDLISRYLDTKDIFNLMRVNKECLKAIINFLISKTEISIEILEDEIKKLKNFNSNVNFENLTKKPFIFSANSNRAISLLNSNSGKNILKLNPEQLNKKEIILAYSLYFIAIGHKKDILFMDEIDKITYMQNYFKNNCSESITLGKLIEKELNGRFLDDKIISILYSLSKKQLKIISPNYFQKINKDVAIFVFIIKDLLEQIGLLGTQLLKPDKEFMLLNSRLQTNRAILDELNKIEEYIY